MVVVNVEAHVNEKTLQVRQKIKAIRLYLTYQPYPMAGSLLFSLPFVVSYKYFKYNCPVKIARLKAFVLAGLNAVMLNFRKNI